MSHEIWCSIQLEGIKLPTHFHSDIHMLFILIYVCFPCFIFIFLGWPFLFLTLAVQEAEKDYNYAFGPNLIMNNEPPAVDL